MKWIHNLLKCFSFSAVLFTFQACYGDMQDEIYDCEFAVRVVDGDGNGIPNVEVTMTDQNDRRLFLDTTTTAGMAYVKRGIMLGSVLKMQFKPLDGVDFQAKDTTVGSWSHTDHYTITLEHK